MIFHSYYRDFNIISELYQPKKDRFNEIFTWPLTKTNPYIKKLVCANN